MEFLIITDFLQFSLLARAFANVGAAMHEASMANKRRFSFDLDDFYAVLENFHTRESWSA